MEYDVVIVGGGITGTSLLYSLSRFTDIKNILLIEKYSDFAMLNSNARSNSQTLHFGDVETNYTVEKAIKTKKASEYILNYIRNSTEKDEKIIQKCQKMVLGVGDEEVKMLEETYQNIKNVFPGLKKIGKEELKKIEPNVINGRNPGEKILALLSDNGYMVNFGMLSSSFAKKARLNNKNIEIKFDTAVKKAKIENGLYKLETNKGNISSKFVVFAAGTYSLYFAKMFGYDQNLSILNIGGGFYYSKRFLNGKVYRVQHGHIPFAAIHADPDITNPDITRYGPTVTLSLTLERGHIKTFPDYIRTFNIDISTLISLKRILLDRDIRRIIQNNAVYSIPVIGKYQFLKKEAKIIIPKLSYGDLHINNNTGGIRPQIIDENKKFITMGEAKLQKEGLIFNITPSPGASSCLGNALEDVIYITKYLGKNFDINKFNKELGGG